MKTAKVEQILKTTKWDKWEHWPIYYISMKMDNGETINLWKKSENAFKVWDSITYEENWENRWKEVKENNFRKSFNPEANNKSATLWMAIKVAFECMYDKKEQNYKETMALAYRIYEDALEMLNGTKEEKSESKEDEVDLPF